MKRRGLVAATAAVFCSAAATAAITSRSYVPTGLVAQYDGINNAGHDAVHNPSASTWVNLTGDTSLDGTVDSNVVWGEDGWSVSTKCNPITVGNALSQTTGTGTFTIQFACTMQAGANGSRQCFFSQYNASNSLGIEQSSSAIRAYSSARSTGLLSKFHCLATNEWGSFTVMSDNGMRDFCFYKNQEPWGERYFKNAAIINTNCVSVIGGEPYVDARDMAFRGTYNAFRIYDRVLTDGEVKINAAVDAVRFNGGDWSDYPELAAYSFTANGTLQFNLVATAEAGGTVRLGDGAESADVRAAYAYNGAAQSATFTAVPASGYAFYRWKGDVDAIAEGSLVTPTITVTSAKAATLTAVFKRQWRGPTSRSYVTPGLVAQYDGIKNVGHDADHSDNTSTWVDLTGNGNDAVKNANVTWVENGWQNSVDCYPMTIPEGNGSATTVAGTIATKVFTMQFAVTPSRHNARQCFFGQYSQPGSFSIEHNSSSGAAKVGFFRFYYYYTDKNATDDVFDNSLTLQKDEWASMSAVSELDKQSIWKNGTSSLTLTKSLAKKLTNICESVIGGDNLRTNMAFRGTYNAFRLYNRVLTADEMKVNAAVDAIRFNGASASSYTLSGGYSFAQDGTLMVDVSAEATEGGKVKYRDGAPALSVADTLTQDGSTCVVFTAVPDAGYVFQEWTGDVDAITDGTILKDRIVVDSSRPVSLTAVFRRSDTLDGMVLDLEISSEREGPFQNAGSWRIGNALKLSERPNADSTFSCYYTLYSNSASYPDYSPNFKLHDVAVPAVPGVTNLAQTCIYYPQYSITSNSMFGVRTETRHACVEGSVATFYVRFLWEGSTRESQINMCTVLMNGIDGTSKVTVHGQGFMLRLYSPADSGHAFPDAFVSNSDISHYTLSEVDANSDLFIETNRWVDCVISVYPSPTNESLSNMDLWYCQAPASASERPVLKHRHIGDNWAHPKLTTSASICNHIMIGSVHSGSLTDYYAQRAFRGSIAAVKAWRRLLSESEIWALMTSPYGGTFRVGVENGSADEFGAEGLTEATFNPATMAWRQMKKSLTDADRTLTLVAPIPAESDGMPRMLEIAPLFDGVGASCPVTVTANGSTVGTFDLKDAAKRAIVLRGAQARRDASGKITIAITRPAECEGTLSFDAISLGGSWRVGEADGAPLVLSGSGDSISLCFDVPKTRAEIVGYRYRTRVASVSGRAARHVRLTLNGDTVWSASDVSANQSIEVDIAVGDMNPGVNELAWHLDSTDAGSGVTFDYHRLKMKSLPDGMAIIVR